MAGLRRRMSRVAALIGLGLLASAAAAQPLPDVPMPPPRVGPGVGPGSNPLAPPRPETPPPAPTPTATLTEPMSPAFNGPLPGSVEDEFTTELNARRGFRVGTWQGGEVIAFPNTLLWDPALAVKRDPRMQVLLTDQQNYRSDWTLDTQIGGTVGLFRWETGGSDTSYQLDIFGAVSTRLSPDDLLLADYRFGIPLTWRRGWWQAKLAYEHTSAHLGDELLKATGRTFIPSWSKDEVVLGLGCFATDELRLYGHFGYALQFVVPGVQATSRTRSRFDIGGEWYNRQPTGFYGTPFVAANLEWRGDQDFTPNWTLQAGWMWRNPFTRFGQSRVFVEHYRGRSPYGHFFDQKESFTSVGLAFDY